MLPDAEGVFESAHIEDIKGKFHKTCFEVPMEKRLDIVDLENVRSGGPRRRRIGNKPRQEFTYCVRNLSRLLLLNIGDRYKGQQDGRVIMALKFMSAIMLSHRHEDQQSFGEPIIPAGERHRNKGERAAAPDSSEDSDQRHIHFALLCAICSG
jgi:hypothetical protein